MRLANPASVYCQEAGGSLHFEDRTTGEQEAMCVFRNGQRCEEWALFRGECESGDKGAGPYAYCKRVTSSGVHPAPQSAELFPAILVQPMIEQGLISKEKPQAVRLAAQWRCMRGNVWVCVTGANIPCDAKADLSRAPSPEVAAFCQTNPGQTVIPAYVTGRSTVYAWECADNIPGIKRQVLTPDEAGYLSEFWYELRSKDQQAKPRD